MPYLKIILPQNMLLKKLLIVRQQVLILRHVCH